MEWNLIDTAPFDRDLELAVIDGEGAHALSFPCRHIEGGWIDVILLAYRHGLRAAELCQLRWSQIDLKHGRLHVNRSIRCVGQSLGRYGLCRERARTSL